MSFRDNKMTLFSVQEAGLLGELPAAACSECDGGKPDVPGPREGELAALLLLLVFRPNRALPKGKCVGIPRHAKPTLVAGEGCPGQAFWCLGGLLQGRRSRLD